ncbi:MAG: hypothetical protein JWQ71_3534 [Pedosphaera sp.]|nr:hypothetical protein [Pedosphaera sp.]
MGREQCWDEICCHGLAADLDRVHSFSLCGINSAGDSALDAVAGEIKSDTQRNGARNLVIWWIKSGDLYLGI